MLMGHKMFTSPAYKTYCQGNRTSKSLRSPRFSFKETMSCISAEQGQDVSKGL